jgi:hypothetical protein
MATKKTTKKATKKATKRTTKKTTPKTAKKTVKKTVRRRTAPQATGGVLELDRTEAVGVIKALGFDSADTLSNEKLLMRVRKVPQYMEVFEGKLNTPEKKLADAITKAVGAKQSIAITGSTPKTAKKKTAKKKTAGKKTAGKTTPREPAANSDRYGRREGTQGHDIDAALIKSPKHTWTIEQLAKKSKQEARRCRQHMVWMCRMGFAKHIKGKGYRLTGKQR